MDPPQNPGGDIYILTMYLAKQFLVAPIIHHIVPFLVWRGVSPCVATSAGFFVAGKAAVTLSQPDALEILNPILPDNQLGLEETQQTMMDTPSAAGAEATPVDSGKPKAVEPKGTVEPSPTPKSLNFDSEDSREKLCGFLRAFEEIKPFLITSQLPEVEKQVETLIPPDLEDEKSKAMNFLHTVHAHLTGLWTFAKKEPLSESEAPDPNADIERPGEDSVEPSEEIKAKATSHLEGAPKTSGTPPPDKNVYWQLLVQKMLLVLLPSIPF